VIRPGKPTARVRVDRFEAGERAAKRDVVTVEEPLEIRVTWSDSGVWTTRNVAVTMRTPGDDFELAAGFLFGEGLVGAREDIHEIAYCGEEAAGEYNVVTVRLREGASFDPALLDRNFYTTSSCGVCGKASLEAVEIRGCRPFAGALPRVAPSVLAGLPGALRGGQSVFDRTGGLHAAGVFAADGRLDLLHEDVGRHNAVDKVVGRSLLAGEVPLADRLLAVSGRASFEIMQKALAAGIPVVAAVGAPSSLAVEVARRFRMTLAGFVRDGAFNLYTDPGRIGEGD
jgi:FdhD protein